MKQPSLLSSIKRLAQAVVVTPAQRSPQAAATGTGAAAGSDTSAPPLAAAATHTRRLMWLLNHKTLMPVEVSILRSLGYAVFVPKIVPDGPEFGNTVVTFEYDAALNLPSEALKDLNAHNFYQDAWTGRVEEIINGNFDVIVASVYPVPLRESVLRFNGGVILRVFGREGSLNYSGMFEAFGADLPLALSAMGRRLVFGQGFDNVGDIENAYLRTAARTLVPSLPESIWAAKDTWIGTGSDAVLLMCPKISGNSYYEPIYREMKALYEDVPHRIFGRQYVPVSDPCVLPYLSDSELIELYRSSPVFAYHSTEARHLHYSPVEAMVIGTPVLYRAGSMIDILAGTALPGRCVDLAELKAKALRLWRGDAEFSARVRASQSTIIEAFSPVKATSQWQAVLKELDAVPRRLQQSPKQPDAHNSSPPVSGAASSQLKFYGQFDEPVDRFIFARYFPDLDIKGTFVECGAFDGQTECSCKFFEETMGWRGVNLEPVPHIFERLRLNRPRSTNLNFGLSNAKRKAAFDSVIHPRFGRYTTIGSLDHSRDVRDMLEREGCEFERIEVQLLTWQDLIEAASLTTVDLFVLDVEGHEMAVLEGMRASAVLPHVMCVEYGHVGFEALRCEMERIGYVFDVVSFANAYFIRKDMLPLFAFRAMSGQISRRLA